MTQAVKKEDTLSVNYTCRLEEKYIADIPKADILEDMKLGVGMQVQLSGSAGNPILATVVEILDDVIRMDANHPLAGKTLIFDIEIAENGL